MADYDEGGPPPSKASLIKWWKAFTSKDKHHKSSSTNNTRGAVVPAPNPTSTSTSSYIPPGRGLERGKDGQGRVFGVSLEQSLQYASVAISMVGQSDGKQYVYGYVPIVVAKCGMMLKETATQTEGIFRVSGSNKRINNLQLVFDEPPRYGKDFDWTGYSVHDAASVLRRYLNSLPEPVIPQGLYLDFTQVLQKQQQQKDHLSESITAYRHLISLLPPASRYLLLYLLDFLSVFARCSNKNLMTASNLAVVFQPGLVSSRREGTNSALLGFPGFVEGKLPSKVGSGGAQEQAGEHGKGKEVLEFLIEQQASFMIGLEPPVDLERQKNKGVSVVPPLSPSPSPSPKPPQQQQQSVENTGGSPLPQLDVTTTTTTKTTNSSGSKDLVRRGSDKSIERRRLRKSTDNAGKEGGSKVKRSKTWGSSSGKRKARNERGESPSTNSQPLSTPITSFVSPSTAPSRPSVAAIPPSLSPPSHLEPTRLYASPRKSAASTTDSSTVPTLSTQSGPHPSPLPIPSTATTPAAPPPPPPPSSAAVATPFDPSLSSSSSTIPKEKDSNKPSPGTNSSIEFEGPRWATRVKKTNLPSSSANDPPPTTKR